MYHKAEQMYPIVKGYLEGSSSKKSVSEANNISPQVLSYWIKKYNRSITGKSDVFTSLAIEVPPTNEHTLLIELPNGTRIEIPMS